MTTDLKVGDKVVCKYGYKFTVVKLKPATVLLKSEKSGHPYMKILTIEQGIVVPIFRGTFFDHFTLITQHNDNGI